MNKLETNGLTTVIVPIYSALGVMLPATPEVYICIKLHIPQNLNFTSLHRFECRVKALGEEFLKYPVVTTLIKKELITVDVIFNYEQREPAICLNGFKYESICTWCSDLPIEELVRELIYRFFSNKE